MRITTAAITLVLLTPRATLACAVCGLIGSEENGAAYLAMTLVLSGLPLLLIGSVATWLYRRALRADAAAPEPDRGTEPATSWPPLALR